MSTDFRVPASYYDPPVLDVPDEICDGGDHDLNDHVYEVGGQYLCSGCVRSMLVSYYQNAFPTCLDEAPDDVVRAERCSDCGMYRCGCPDER